jgi:hypothetical protein
MERFEGRFRVCGRPVDRAVDQGSHEPRAQGAPAFGFAQAAPSIVEGRSSRGVEAEERLQHPAHGRSFGGVL